MAQVPFTGVQTVAPQDNPIPRDTVQATPEAFGVNVWQAVRQLGSTADQVGQEVFTRGLAMQDLANHSEAQEATAQFMAKAGEIHAKLGAMQGKDAVNYFSSGQFNSDLQDARKGLRDGLSNSMSQKLFDAESLSTIGRTVFNGAGIAATANKQYAISSNEAQTKQQVDIAATSNNPNDVAAARTRIKGLAQEHAALKGQDPNTGEEYAKGINSSLDFNVVQQMSRTDPIKAGEILEERRDQMTAQDYDRARTVVDNANRSVGSANIASKIISQHIGDDGKADVSFEDMVAEAKEAAHKQAPDDALMEKHTVDALRGLYNQKIYADKQFKYQNQQTVADRIQQGVTTVQELRADPATATAMDNLPKSDQLKIPGQINAFNAARDKVQNQQAMTTIAGLRNNDVEKFLNLDTADMAKMGLNQPQIVTVLGWQRQDSKNQNGDPRVNRALQWIRDAKGAQLQALGVYHRDSKDPDNYDHMTGTLQSALEEWQVAHGKPPSYDDVINKIAPQVLQTRTIPGYFGTSIGSEERPFFTQDVPEDFKKGYLANVNPNASDAEIYKANNRRLLRELYKSSASGVKGDLGAAQ